MGFLHAGRWQNQDSFPTDEKGAFVRASSSFLDTIADTHPRYQPEKARYHLYVSLACPWAHRTLIMRELKGLQDIIGVSVVHPHMLDHGWEFRGNFPGSSPDQLYQSEYLFQLYVKSKPDYTGRVTVPVLWDKNTSSIVNNESEKILRIFNSAFNRLTSNHEDYYPASLQEEIDATNQLIYDSVNNGVYRAGFAKSQSAYEEAVYSLFEALDLLDKRLEGRRFLIEDRLTETDIRLFTTLVRFDPVYHYHFKCNIKKIKDFKNLSSYLSSLLKHEAFSMTTSIEQVKAHYYYSHASINPYRIVPVGPAD